MLVLEVSAWDLKTTDSNSLGPMNLTKMPAKRITIILSIN